MPRARTQSSNPLDDLSGRKLPLRKNHWRDLIRTLDPVRDAQRIHRLTVSYEFPWDYQRALELALYRSYCLPSVSSLLVTTGEFRDRPQKRYDDTALLMGELVESGYDSPRGREALRVVNRQHARWDISNDDMLYVLSTFIYEPLDWIDRFGWRRLEPNERLASFHFYAEVGRRMGVRNIPDDMDELRRWRDDYENRHFAHTADTATIGGYTRDLMESWYPAPLRPLVRAVVYSIIDEPMRRSFGYPHMLATLRVAVFSALRTRGRALRLAPPRKVGLATTAIGSRTYPLEYRPSELGACPMPADPAEQDRREPAQ